jgi:hypothetical protein
MRGVPPDGGTVTLSSADPLNLAGILVPGERVAATTGKFVVFSDGAAVSSEKQLVRIPPPLHSPVLKALPARTS